jgi:hypothetical protein
MWKWILGWEEQRFLRNWLDMSEYIKPKTTSYGNWSFARIWYFVSHPNGITNWWYEIWDGSSMPSETLVSYHDVITRKFEGVRETGYRGEENICTLKGWRLEKIAHWGCLWLYFSRNVLRVMNSRNEMGGTCSTHENDVKCVRNFSRRPKREWKNNMVGRRGQDSFGSG